MRAIPLQRANSVRFDRDESPYFVNDGKGWTEEHAQKWIERQGLVGQGKSIDDMYIRFKLRDGKKVERTWDADVGVTVIICER